MIQVEAPLRESLKAQMKEHFGMTEKMPRPVEERPCKRPLLAVSSTGQRNTLLPITRQFGCI